MTSVRLFVYGSMSEGMVHFKRIENLVLSISPARVKARAYRLQVGFPVLVQGESELVPGHLIELKGSDLFLGLLDEFYGYNQFDPAKSLHHRELASVETSEGLEQAWVYFMNPAKLPKSAVHIEGGDWVGSLQSQPPLTERLTERQATYIQKLGKCKGRDIVPIDLPLYRELMNLELIVDKGRRLALSKLGQEVCRYLE